MKTNVKSIVKPIALLTLAMFSMLALTTEVMGGGVLSVSGTSHEFATCDTLRVSTTIREQVAVTVTTQQFTIPTGIGSSEVAFGFPLPEGATLTGFRWKVDSTWYKATLQSSDTTAEGGGSGSNYTGFARTLGETPFVFAFVDSMEAGAKITTEVTYVELAHYGNGAYTYLYPAGFHRNSGGVVGEWTVDLKSGQNILSTTFAPYTMNATTVTDKQRTYSIEDTVLDGQWWECTFKIEYGDLTMNILSTKPADEDGYAIMTAVPKSRVEEGEVLPKRFFFVLDKSGSMGGSKIQYAREAAIYCIERLNTNDLFNVLAFNGSVHNWKPSPVTATPTNVVEAVRHVETIRAGGSNNDMGALMEALDQMASDQYVNVIIYLADGQGRMDMPLLKQSNTTSTRIFGFGVGRDVREDVMRQLVTEHGGLAEFVVNASDVVPAISALWEKIRDPLIKNPGGDLCSGCSLRRLSERHARHICR